MKSQYYKEIMDLPEKGSFTNILQKWEQLGKRIESLNCKCSNIIPEIFLVGAPGIGKSHLFSLISAYLKDKGLIDFAGEVDFMEFHFEYCPEGTNFPELNRFVESMDRAAGFRSSFRGVVCIELDEWFDYYKEKYFNIFMEYLEENCDNWLIIFSVDGLDNKKVDELYSYLAMYFRLDRADLSMPSEKEYVDYLEGVLAENSFTISKKAHAVLTKTVASLKKNPLFDGYKSLNRLAQDIAYKKYTAAEFESTVIDEDDVKDFASDSSYVCNMVKNYERKQFGFVSGGSSDDK